MTAPGWRTTRANRAFSRSAAASSSTGRGSSCSRKRTRIETAEITTLRQHAILYRVFQIDQVHQCLACNVAVDDRQCRRKAGRNPRSGSSHPDPWTRDKHKPGERPQRARSRRLPPLASALMCSKKENWRTPWKADGAQLAPSLLLRVRNHHIRPTVRIPAASGSAEGCGRRPNASAILTILRISCKLSAPGALETPIIGELTVLSTPPTLQPTASNSESGMIRPLLPRLQRWTCQLLHFLLRTACTG